MKSKFISIIITVVFLIIYSCINTNSENTKRSVVDTQIYNSETKSTSDISTDVRISNSLENTAMVLHSYGLDGGEWKKKPSSDIKYNQVGSMATIANAWLRGAGGWVKYRVQDDGTILKFQWYNPYWGNRTYSATASNNMYRIEGSNSGIGNNAIVTWTVKRKTLPQKYSLIISADPQAWRLSSGDPNSESNRGPWKKTNELVARAINVHNAKFNIINGDLTEFGRKKTYQDYADVYKTSATPVYEGLGNHDYANNVGDCMIPESLNFFPDACAISAVTRMLSEMKRYSGSLSSFRMDVSDNTTTMPNGSIRNIRGSLSYSWDFGDVHYVQLQNYPSYNVFLTENHTKVKITKSLDWLEKDLASADARGKITILNFHDACPVRNDGDSHFLNKENMKDLLRFKEIITSHNVKAIFVGHTHTREYCRANNDKVFGNIPVYTAGALFNGDYYLLDVNGKQINVKAYNGKNGTPILKEDLGLIGKNKKLSNTCSML